MLENKWVKVALSSALLVGMVAVLYYYDGTRQAKEKLEKYAVVTGEAQGTTYRIVYENEKSINLKFKIDSILLNFDNSVSHYNSSSLVSELNAYQKVKADQTLSMLYTYSDSVYQLTNGVFDPSILPLVELWSYFKTVDYVVDTTMLDSVLTLVNFSRVKVKERPVFDQFDSNGNPLNIYDIELPINMGLDFNAIAQGYSVDLIADYFNELAIDNYLIEIGGELKGKGVNPFGDIWSIGIDSPVELTKEREVNYIALLNNRSMATSGSYRKFFEKDGKKYSHTLDTKTGVGVTHQLLSVTVVCPEAWMADALSTTFMIMGRERSTEFIDKHPELELSVYFIESGDENKEWRTSFNGLPL